MALANSVLEPKLESVFLMASEQFAHISSTLIKQIAHMSKSGTRDKLVAFVPECIIDPLLRKVAK
jgi:pantetheine-phosphate adenylyltransferase